MKTVDPRAGRLCSHCNYQRQANNRAHCVSSTCSWWVCLRCGASNDAAGNNSKSDSQGRAKAGSAL
ncbi:hypothetical protein [Cellulomonas sp. C5510]|uniref:hypothetical protein n=1 Tax=Cellulomonas sp. C5510 TaxID=2871170 RepID=UPI001C940EB3|nr:hypothetical protein [Cellulomonas sp. C5510]QZN86934.1 hypothetical protein K5O09_07435 [Cellulomonas sp. C5510]